MNKLEKLLFIIFAEEYGNNKNFIESLKFRIKYLFN
jgi:hypothetical protein